MNKAAAFVLSIVIGAIAWYATTYACVLIETTYYRGRADGQIGMNGFFVGLLIAGPIVGMLTAWLVYRSSGRQRR